MSGRGFNQVRVWHDEMQRFERTGRLDEGPCWCENCIAEDAGPQHECAPPNPLGRLVGTTWQCGTCGVRWVLAHVWKSGRPTIRARWERLG